jgi:hypothetical protein
VIIEANEVLIKMNLFEPSIRISKNHQKKA